jgi:flagellar biosynthesis protein
MNESKAVAIRYESALPAPFIVAKGKGRLAERIIELAEEHNIHVSNMPELTEALYPIELGEFLPEELYQVVAELLVFVRSVRIKNET